MPFRACRMPYAVCCVLRAACCYNGLLSCRCDLRFAGRHSSRNFYIRMGVRRLGGRGGMTNGGVVPHHVAREGRGLGERRMR